MHDYNTWPYHVWQSTNNIKTYFKMNLVVPTPSSWQRNLTLVNGETPSGRISAENQSSEKKERRNPDYWAIYPFEWL